MAAHRIGHPNPADQKGGQSNKGQKEGQPFDKAAQSRVGIGGIAHAPPSIFKLLIKPFTKRGRCFTVIQIQSVIITDQASGLHQSGLHQGILGHH